MTNVPAGTISAVVMVVFGRWKLLASCVHVKAAAGDAANPIAAAAAADCTYLEARRLFRSLVIIVLPPCLERGHCRIVFSFGRLHAIFAITDCGFLLPASYECAPLSLLLRKIGSMINDQSVGDCRRSNN